MGDWALRQQFHTVVTCRDIGESVAFYELLGFEILSDHRDVEWPDSLAELLGLKRAKGRGVLMGLPSDPGGPMLDLVEWVEPKAVFSNPGEEVQGGMRRTIAFHTRGVQAAFEALSAKGVRFTCSPKPQPEAGVIAVAFCYDPSGNFVELIELDPGLLHPRVRALS
ncbi:VOC family protein [Phenylobacterium sp.]|uniref:VOC family protein n=1 Tax=Phenylobacterium sp. TaxID=1871053 RepID=UPI0025E525FE|nr:VOC family protein [Phenylobacterium sp.]